MESTVTGKAVRKQRVTFTQEYKRQLVARLKTDGRSVAAIAREHGIHVNLLYRWAREFDDFSHRSAVPQMLPVSVTDEVQAHRHSSGNAPGLPQGETAAGSIILTTRQGCCLQIIGRPDEVLLQRVLQMAFA